ncbi:MAG: methyltransferase domain-containing protein [Gammaproteobacteria bacterium]|nr:methyltransferase domain-containing protein [Gammaproteobacteria bacterium]
MNITRTIKSLINSAGLIYAKKICAREYNSQTYMGFNERAIEFSFLFTQLTKLWPKTILDVGTGMTALPHMMRNCGFHVTAIDNIKDYWTNGMVNRHYHIIDDDISNTKLTDTYDVITCISVLEHINDHRAAMMSMYRLLNPGGHLILTCPYTETEYVNNVYTLPESSVHEDFPFITQSFSRNEVDNWLIDSPFNLIEQEYWQFFEGNYWTCGEKLSAPNQVKKENTHQLSCMLFAKNQ